MEPGTDQPTTGELAHELRETLGRLVRRLRREPGAPAPQLAVLGRLDREGGRAGISVSDLAAAERMRPQSMAQTVHDLEAAGWVTRRPDPDDKRRQIVELAPAGVELLRTTRARREGWLSAALERELTAEERARLAEAVVLLGRMADA